MDRVEAWWTLARSQWLVALSRPMSLATGVFTPLMLMAILLLPRLETLTPEQATRTFSGVLLASFWGASLWSGAGIIRRERAQGTLGASVTGRLGVLTVLLGKVSGGVLFDVGIVCLTNVVFVLVAGIRLQVAHPAAFAVGLAEVVVCGVASSLMLAGVLMLSRYAFQLTTAVGTPVLLLGARSSRWRCFPTGCRGSARASRCRTCSGS